MARREPRQRVQREDAADRAQGHRQTAVVGVEEDRRLEDMQVAVGMRQHLVAERGEVAMVQPRVGVAHGDYQVRWVESPGVDQFRLDAVGSPGEIGRLAPNFAGLVSSS